MGKDLVCQFHRTHSCHVTIKCNPHLRHRSSSRGCTAFCSRRFRLSGSTEFCFTWFQCFQKTFLRHNPHRISPPAGWLCDSVWELYLLLYAAFVSGFAIYCSIVSRRLPSRRFWTLRTRLDISTFFSGWSFLFSRLACVMLASYLVIFTVYVPTYQISDQLEQYRRKTEATGSTVNYTKRTQLVMSVEQHDTLKVIPFTRVKGIPKCYPRASSNWYIFLIYLCGDILDYQLT